jgi:hypothetical protein
MMAVWRQTAAALSFPRKRESSGAAAFLDPCLRRGDKGPHTLFLFSEAPTITGEHT